MADPITALPTPPSRSVPSTFSTLADAFIAALPTFVTEVNAVATALNFTSTTSTSSTSLTIGTGAQSLTVEASKGYVKGMTVKIAYDATNWMQGEVTSYNDETGALVVNVTITNGSGTQTDWAISLGCASWAGITSADATLSGTPIIITVYDAASNTPYYFKAYPTK